MSLFTIGWRARSVYLIHSSFPSQSPNFQQFRPRQISLRHHAIYYSLHFTRVFTLHATEHSAVIPPVTFWYFHRPCLKYELIFSTVKGVVKDLYVSIEVSFKSHRQSCNIFPRCVINPLYFLAVIYFFISSDTVWI